MMVLLMVVCRMLPIYFAEDKTLEIKSAGGRVSASVTLARGCDTYTGHGESANTPFALSLIHI